MGVRGRLRFLEVLRCLLKTLGDQAERQEVGNYIEGFAGTLGWARADKANGSPLNPYHHSDTIIINKESDLLGQPLRYKKNCIFLTLNYMCIMRVWNEQNPHRQISSILSMRILSFSCSSGGSASKGTISAWIKFALLVFGPGA